MTVTETPIQDLLIIEPAISKDSRGYFYESFNTRKLKDAGIKEDFVQDNQSASQRGVLRGLHAQSPPFAQGKLVRVLQGSVYDVAVDIRKNSKTYGQHFGVVLSGENHLQFWIPPGFLHGFLALENHTVFAYKVTNFYDKSSEIGVVGNDPTLGINWQGVESENILLSDKDKELSRFDNFESPF